MGSSEASVEVSNSDAESCPAPPARRMGIVHLLGWTALVGFALGLHQDYLWVISERPTGSLSAIGILQELISVLMLGADLLCVCIAARRWGEGERFPNEPGEWMLFAPGSGYLVMNLFGPTLLYLLSPISAREHFWIQGAITYGSALTFWMLPFILLRHSPYRWYFLVHALGYLYSLGFQCAVTFGGYVPEDGNLLHLLYALSAITGLGPLIALLYGLWRDHRQPSEGGWLHALGLSVTLLGEASFLGLAVALPLLGPWLLG